MNRRIIQFLFIFLLLCFISCKRIGDPIIGDQNQKSLTDILQDRHLKKEELSILIDKSDYTLTVKTNDDIIKVFPIVLGTNPVDDKLMEGDRSTPEGNFKVLDFYPHASWSKFIWIDYPTQTSWIKHITAKNEQQIPQDATIGGEIGIHGVPAGKDDLISQKINWTYGCISLTTDNINELYAVIYKDMTIVIIP